MDNRRIAAYLASGLPPADVAKIVGCSTSYLVSLVTTEEFKEILQEEIDKPVEDEEKREEDNLTKKYLSKEHKLLDAIDGALQSAELPAIVRALEVVGNRQIALKKLGQRPVEGNRTLNIINLQVPSHALKQPVYILNETSEVISIDGNSMAPMTSQGVTKLFSAMRGTGKETIEASPEVIDELGFSYVEPHKKEINSNRKEDKENVHKQTATA